MRPRAFLLTAACLLTVGCACTKRNHQAVTNWLDRTVVPENRAAQWALTPVLVPVGVCTLAVDNVVVTPIVHLPSVTDDAGEWLSERLDGYYSQMGVFPIQIALTPIVFAGDWLFRGFFALKTDRGAVWGWPDWGVLWVRDDNGRLLGPSTQFDPRTKKRIPRKD